MLSTENLIKIFQGGSNVKYGGNLTKYSKVDLMLSTGKFNQNIPRWI